jgi:putative copper export protein
VDFVVAKFLHVVSAAIALGGIAVILWALMPSLGGMDAGGAAAVSDRVARRFGAMVWIVIVLLLATGIYMLVRVTTGGVPSRSYHAIVGIKILLALAVFVIALGTTLPMKALESMRQNRRRWMIINIHLIAIVFFLGVWLGNM